MHEASIRENSVDDLELSTRPSLEMNAQNDNCHITGESIAVVFLITPGTFVQEVS